MKRSKGKRTPSRKARASGAPKIPTAIERFAHARLTTMAKSFAAYVRRAILPRVKDFARPEKEERTDAIISSREKNPAAKAEGKKMQAAADTAFSSKALRSLSDQVVRKMVSHSKDQFQQLGINVKKEPELKWLVAGWTRDLAERVKGTTKDQVRKLEDILATGGARHAETMAREIEEQLGVTASRAAFIARDSITTLNSKITRHRFEAAGIAAYIWTTMDDERVRERHAELDGVEFEVDGPGDETEEHPGMPPGCRCVAFPLKPESAPSEDEDEAPTEDEDE